MEDYDPKVGFGAGAAEHYDDVLRGDEEETVAFLEGLAGSRRVLELAVGTGRIALPLAARGVTVDGIELSEAMVAKLRAKPGGDRIEVTIADMAEVDVPRRYGLIYLVFNTLFNLVTQEGQVRCFETVAAHLEDEGVFVVEALVPASLYRLRDHQYVDAEAVAAGSVTLDVGRYDPVTQVLDENHVTLSRDGVRLGPIVTRYVWPSEMDLMARIAGLRLHDRWAGWNREPFTATSQRHVSVYGR